MSILKGTLLALGLGLASVTSGFAADGGMEDGMAWTLNPSGHPINAQANAGRYE